LRPTAVDVQPPIPLARSRGGAARGRELSRERRADVDVVQP